MGSLSNYKAATGSMMQGGSWFPGTPCTVTVTGSGCYLAWSNSTTYMEEGNYILSTLNYVPSVCPNCSRAPPATPDGMCSSDGSVTCSATNVNYRCIATKVSSAPPPPPPPPTTTPSPSATSMGPVPTAATAVLAAAAAAAWLALRI